MSPKQEQYGFYLKPDEQRRRTTFLCLLMLFSLLLFFKHPIIDHTKSSQLKHTDSLNNNVQTMEQHRRYVLFSKANFVYTIVSGVLIIIFSILLKKEKRNPDEDDDRSGLVEPIKLLRITDRVETTAIIVIQMFEILELFEETMVDIDGSVVHGVFAQIFKRIFFIILIACQYYPILASLQFQNISVRLLVVIYFMGSMIYRTWFDSSAKHFILFWIKYSRSIDLCSWWFMHSVMKSIVHYGFVGYICAELATRLLYDSIYIGRQRGEKINKIPHRTIEQYSYSPDRANKRFIIDLNKDKTDGNLRRKGFLNRIRRYLALIYEWDNTFRYTTIVVCTYAVAYIFLFHLTGTIILLYSARTNDYVGYIKEILKAMLNTDITNESLQTEVIISAIVTTIIYSIQLFLSIKNVKRSVNNLYKIFSANPESEGRKLNNREIIRKSTQYPSYLLLYLLGGYFLCFHLILFIVLIIERLLFFRTKPSKMQAMIECALPFLVVYVLQKIIILWLYKACDWFDKRNFGENNSDKFNRIVPKIKLSILDSILLYLKLISCTFIGILASIIRLLFSVLINIVFMPRIDYSYLVEPLESIDSAHESFRAFIRLEMLIVYPLMLEFSRSVAPTTNAPIPPRETNTGTAPADQAIPSERDDDNSSINDYAQETNESRLPDNNGTLVERALPENTEV